VSQSRQTAPSRQLAQQQQRFAAVAHGAGQRAQQICQPCSRGSCGAGGAWRGQIVQQRIEALSSRALSAGGVLALAGDFWRLWIWARWGIEATRRIIARRRFQLHQQRGILGRGAVARGGDMVGQLVERAQHQIHQRRVIGHCPRAHRRAAFQTHG
jgi:hypothetical protein